MDTANTIALVAVSLTAVGGGVTTLIGIWKNGKSAGRSEAAAERVEKAVSQLQEQAITLVKHDKDLEHLKEVSTTFSGQMSTVWAKVFSHDKHLAVQEARRSRPSFDEGE